MGQSKYRNAQIDESLRKICHYQQNVPQHYYLLDTLVIIIIITILTNFNEVYHLTVVYRRVLNKKVLMEGHFA